MATISRSVVGFWAGLLITGVACLGQLPSSHHSLSLEVLPVASGGKSTITNDTKVGKNKSDLMRKRENVTSTDLDLKLRNLGQASAVARLEWYFFSEGIGGHQAIFDQGNKDVTVPAGGLHEETVESGDRTRVKTQRIKSDRDGGVFSQGGSGQRVRGWIVRLIIDGQVDTVRASGKTLEDLGRDSVTLAKYPHRK